MTVDYRIDPVAAHSERSAHVSALGQQPRARVKRRIEQAVEPHRHSGGAQSLVGSGRDKAKHQAVGVDIAGSETGIHRLAEAAYTVGGANASFPFSVEVRQKKWMRRGHHGRVGNQFKRRGEGEWRVGTPVESYYLHFSESMRLYITARWA